MIDTTGAPTVADWSTDRYAAACYSSAFPFYARDVDFSDDGSYFVIGADGGSGDAYCDAIARLETADRGAVAGHLGGLHRHRLGDLGRGGRRRRLRRRSLPLAEQRQRQRRARARAASTGTASARWTHQRRADELEPDPLARRQPAGRRHQLGPDRLGDLEGRQRPLRRSGLRRPGQRVPRPAGLFPAAGGRTIAVQDAPTAASGYLYLGDGTANCPRCRIGPGGLGTIGNSTQPNLVGAKGGVRGGQQGVLGEDRHAPRRPAAS